MVVGPVGAVGNRDLSSKGAIGAVVQGLRGTTSRTHAFSRDDRVVVLSPAASTGHRARGTAPVFWFQDCHSGLAHK